MKIQISIPRRLLLILFLGFGFKLYGESARVIIAGTSEISLANPGASIQLSYNSSALIKLGQDLRFYRGIELELNAPQGWLPYGGSLAVVFYADLNTAPAQGVADIEGRQIFFQPLPDKIQNIYQIPLQAHHGIKNTPYTLVTGALPAASYPLVFRIMPVIKGISEGMESLVFTLHVKPILNDKGAVKIGFRYPAQLQAKPLTVLIDDMVVEKPEEELLLNEGEHHLLVLSDNYRNESRRFLVEKAKILDISIALKDPTPLILFEAPENAVIYLDNGRIHNPQEAFAVEPGIHEIRFQLSDYSVTRSITVQKGKTYKAVLLVDVNFSENE
jgi:hypothetical protein